MEQRENALYNVVKILEWIWATLAICVLSIVLYFLVYALLH